MVFKKPGSASSSVGLSRFGGGGGAPPLDDCCPGGGGLLPRWTSLDGPPVPTGAALFLGEALIDASLRTPHSAGLPVEP